MPIDDESLADDVERMEQRRRDSLAFIRQRDRARVAGGEPIAGSAAADRHALIVEVERLTLKHDAALAALGVFLDMADRVLASGDAIAGEMLRCGIAEARRLLPPSGCRRRGYGAASAACAAGIGGSTVAPTSSAPLSHALPRFLLLPVPPLAAIARCGAALDAARRDK